MTTHALIENVSRRSLPEVDRGCTGGLRAGAAAGRPFRQAPSAYATGADDMPHGTVNDPHVFVAIDPDGHGDHHRPSLRDGHRLAHQPADGRRRRDGGRLGAGEASSRRRATSRATATRTPTARAACGTSSSRCASAVRRCARCWSRRRPSSGAWRRRGRGPEPRGRARGVGPEARLRRARRRGDGPADAAGRPAEAQGRGRLPLHGQGQRPDHRPARHHHRQGGLRLRRPAAGHEVSRWSARPPVVGGKVKSFDAAAALKVPGRREGGRDPGQRAAGQVRAARRRRGDRQQHLGGDAGPRRAADRLGRRPERRLRLAWRTAPSWRRPRASPGKVVRNQGDAEEALAWAAKVVTAEYYQPHWRTRRWSRRSPRAVVADGKCEVWAPVQSPYGTREDWPKLLGLPIENVTVHVHAARRRLRAQVEVRLRAGGGAAVARRWAARRSRWSGPARTTSSTASTTPSRSSASRRRIDAGRQGGRLAASQRGADDHLDLHAGPEGCEAPFELGMGLRRHAVRDPEPALRERRGAGAHADRLVPLGLQHPARVRDAVASSPSSPQAAGKDPKDFLLELIGPARQLDSGADGHDGRLWNYGDPYDDLPDRHRPARQRGRAGGRAGRLGPRAAQGPWARHRRPSQLPDLRRDRGRGRGRRAGPPVDPARRHRDRLRLRRSTRSGSARRWRVRR